MRFDKKAGFTTLLIFSFLFLIPFSFAYTQYGGDDGNYLGTISTFNENANFTTSAAVIDTPLNTPLIADVDNDGSEEAVILHDSGFSIYTLPGLSLEKTLEIPIGQRQGGISAHALNDFDDDGYLDIVIVSNKYDILTYEWDGSNMIGNTSQIVAAIDSNTNVSLMGCSDTQDVCLIVYFAYEQSNARVRAVAFNQTTHSKHYDASGRNGTQVQTHSGNTRVWCPSNIKHVDVKDFDGSGNPEFAISYLQVDTGNEEVHVDIMQISDDLVVTFKERVDYALGDAISMSAGQDKCYTYEYWRGISPPLMASITNSQTNQMEILVAAVNSPGETATYDYRLYSFDHNGNFRSNSGNVEGDYISNIALANVASGEDKDWCGAVYSHAENEYKVMCGTSTTCGFGGFLCGFFGTGLYNTFESVGISHNITPNLVSWTNHFHMIDADTSIGGDEVLFDYGTYELERGNDELLPLWTNSFHESAMITDLVQDETGTEDIILIRGSNLWFLDDTAVNSGCVGVPCINEYFINPCLELNWLQNTSAEIRMTLNDNDGDDVQGRVVFYANDTNIQDTGWSANVSSGTTLKFVNDENGVPFTANKTGNNFNIIMYARDSQNYDEWEEVEEFFSVSATSGVVKGDCTTSTSLEPEDAEDVPTIIDTNKANNTIINTVNATGQIFGLGTGVIYFLVLAVICVIILTVDFGINEKPGVKLAECMVVLVVGTILGVLLGIMSFFWIVLIILLGVIVGALAFSRALSGSGGG